MSVSLPKFDSRGHCTRYPSGPVTIFASAIHPYGIKNQNGNFHTFGATGNGWMTWMVCIESRSLKRITRFSCFLLKSGSELFPSINDNGTPNNYLLRIRFWSERKFPRLLLSPHLSPLSSPLLSLSLSLSMFLIRWKRSVWKGIIDYNLCTLTPTKDLKSHQFYFLASRSTTEKRTLRSHYTW